MSMDITLMQRKKFWQHQNADVRFQDDSDELFNLKKKKRKISKKIEST